MRTHDDNFDPVFYDMKAAGLWAIWRALAWLWRARRGVVLLAVLSLALVGCVAQGLPLDDATDGGADDMLCGKAAGVACCGEDGGNSTLWWCAPGLFCNVHRGGGPTLCFPVQDGGTP
jgi:hypothetical protein